jgi:hypothetical protein
MSELHSTPVEMELGWRRDADGVGVHRHRSSHDRGSREEVPHARCVRGGSAVIAAPHRGRRDEHRGARQRRS